MTLSGYPSPVMHSDPLLPLPPPTPPPFPPNSIQLQSPKALHHHPFGRRVSSKGGEKRDSKETGLLKTVASSGRSVASRGGKCGGLVDHMTNPNFGPNRRQYELGLGSCHQEEESEEAPTTRLPFLGHTAAGDGLLLSWALLGPAPRITFALCPVKYTLFQCWIFQFCLELQYKTPVFFVCQFILRPQGVYFSSDIPWKCPPCLPSSPHV